MSHVDGHIHHTPPTVGSPMFFQNISEGLYHVLVYTGMLSFLYLTYLGTKKVYSSLK